MPGDRPSVVLQAHATRAATATALLLHADERGPRDLHHPIRALVGGAVVAVVIVLAVFVASRLGAVLG